MSLVPLHSDETLLSTLSVDFDGDGYDDQINSLKKMTSPYIQILVGLYNPYKGQYERSAIIDTEIIQTRTFSYTSMDFVGTHKNFLMYSGFLENNDSVMKLFSPEKQDTGLVMNMVGDFRSDGTIFVQQLERHESYESQQANGVSFPVWVYRSDTSSGQNSLDQIQTRYVWNETSGKYVKDTETRVQESKSSSSALKYIPTLLRLGPTGTDCISSSILRPSLFLTTGMTISSPLQEFFSVTMPLLWALE